jgi:hypothetical protein
MRHGPSEQVFVIGAVQINITLERIAPRAAIDAVFQPIEGEDAGEDQIVLARLASPCLAGRRARDEHRAGRRAGADAFVNAVPTRRRSV